MEMRVQKILVGILAILIYIGVLVWPEPVSKSAAENVANVWLRFQPEYRKVVQQVGTMRVLYDVAGQKTLGYVFKLEPKGYLVVSIDTQLRPVVAYSYTSDFPWEAVPQNLLLSMLRLDMAYRLEAVQRGIAKTATTTRNEGLWNSYLSESNPQVSPRETGERTQQWGPWVATTWSQGNPYNIKCPIDPDTGERSLTGCVATAMGQICNYWLHPVDVTFPADDDYTTDTRGIFIDASTANLNDLDYYDNGPLEPSSSTTADLLYACGVAVRMDYTSEGSGAFSANVAAALAGSLPTSWSWVVPNRFHYQFADWRTMDPSWPSPYYISTNGFYDLLADNMKSRQPSLLAIKNTTTDTGHAIVCDGYKSTGEYHLNFGWSGYGDGWYSLPSGLPYGYNVVCGGVVNIFPGFGEFVHDEILVGFFDNVSWSEITSFETQYSLTDRNHLFDMNYGYTIANGVPVAQLYPTLNQDYRVRYAEPNYIMHSCSDTSAVFRVERETGNVFSDGPFYGMGFLAGSADVAEWVQVWKAVEPGDVLELDPDNPGHYRKSRGPCSDLVAGVVSTKPGFVLGSFSSTEDSGLSTPDRALLALVGIVPVKVTDEGGPVQPGDLLVTSSTPGCAMRWDPESGEHCNFIGKALEPLESGKGVIQVLLMR